MAKVMVFRHISSTLKSPEGDKFVRGGQVFYMGANGTEVRSNYTHLDLHTDPLIKFMELRDE